MTPREKVPMITCNVPVILACSLLPCAQVEVMMQGVIRMSRQGPREAWVQPVDSQGEPQILIPSKLAINRAIHGDTVAGIYPSRFFPLSASEQIPQQDLEV